MATDYISREKAKEAVCECCLESDDCTFRCVQDIPAADVVEVVRCRDCRYFYDGPDEKCCINHSGVVLTDENGYCHYGKKRTDDE